MDSEEETINKIRTNPILQNESIENYKDRLKINHAWTRVTVKMNNSKKGVRSRWKGVKYGFQNKIKKTPNPPSGKQGTSSAVNCTTKRPNVDDILFMRDMTTTQPIHQNSVEENQNNLRKIQNGSTATQVKSGEESTAKPLSQKPVSGIEQNTHNDDFPIIDFQLLAISDNMAQKNTPSKTTISKKSKTKQQDLAEFYKRMFKTKGQNIIHLNGNQDDAVTNEEEDIYFLKSLAPYFKGLSPAKKLRLRSKIQNLIADEIENPSTSSSSPTDLFPTLQNQYADNLTTTSTSSK